MEQQREEFYKGFGLDYMPANHFAVIDEPEVSKEYERYTPDKVRVGWRPAFKNVYYEHDIIDVLKEYFSHSSSK